MAFSLPAPIDAQRRVKENQNTGFWLAFLLMTLVSIGCGYLMATHLMKTLEADLSSAPVQGASNQLRHDAYSTDQSIREMRPLVTNLESPKDAWVRVAGVLVLADADVDDADLLVARVEEDILAYLRSLTVVQLEGAVGLQHLREDLNERARIRSEGAVSEVILQSLVIQ